MSSKTKKLERRVRKLEKAVKELQEKDSSPKKDNSRQIDNIEIYPPGAPWFRVSPTLVPHIMGR